MAFGVYLIFYLLIYLVVIFQHMDPYYLSLIRRKALALGLCSLILWKAHQAS